MTTNITLPREVVEQALNALLPFEPYIKGGTKTKATASTAIANLRAALATEQPKGDLEAAAKELVRLADIIRDCGRLVSKSGNAEQAIRKAAPLLQSSEPAQVPLTDDEAIALSRQAVNRLHLVRCVEQHHGIGAKP